MADEQKKDTRAFGYSKSEPEGRIFADGTLPPGYFPHPAMVAGSEAEKRYHEDALRDGAGIPWEGNATPLRQDGPTVAEYVAAGYKASAYPPQSYAPRSAPEEIAAAVAAEKAADEAAKAADKASKGR
jgi:hypothetical protein